MTAATSTRPKSTNTSDTASSSESMSDENNNNNLLANNNINVVENDDSDNDDDLFDSAFVLSDRMHGVAFHESLSTFGLIGFRDSIVVQKEHDAGVHHAAEKRAEAKKETPETTTTTTARKPRKKLDNELGGLMGARDSIVVQKEHTLKQQGFDKGQQEMVQEILNEIEAIQARQRSKGMRQWNFTFGLLNCLLVAYVFGAWPGYFWILYLVESTYWITIKFGQMWNTQPLCEILYYLDFCWMMNFSGLVWFGMLFLFMVNPDDSLTIDPELRRQLFMGAYGIAAGPVFMASMALPFVAFLFHDTNTMANLIIHIMPSMLMYVLKWHAETMQAAFPAMFDEVYVQEVSKIPFFPDTMADYWTQGSVSRNSVLVFFAWFLPYTLWMLTVGLSLPKSREAGSKKDPKYDTVFHSLWRNGPCELVGTLVWKRPAETSRLQSEQNNFEVRDLLLYMTGHATACLTLGIHVLSWACYTAEWLHGALLVVAIVICAQRGAQRYTYYTTSMYGQQIQRHFAKKSSKEATSARAGPAKPDKTKKAKFQ